MKRDQDGMVENNYGDDCRKKGRVARKRGKTFEGCKEGYPPFVHAKSGCCKKLTVIQTDSYNRDETI